MTTQTKIAEQHFQYYVWNAPVTTMDTQSEFEILGESHTGAIVLPTCTVSAREVNSMPNYIKLPYASITNKGIPNPGYRKYVEMIPSLEKYKKPIVVSVTAFVEDEFVQMVETFQITNISLLELDVSYPNVNDRDMVGYDFVRLENLLQKVTEFRGKPLGLRLPVYHDITHFEKVAELVRKYKIKFITSVQTIAHTLVIDVESEKPVLKPDQGFGNLGGTAIKPLALGNVRTFYELLKGEVSIIGIGGVSSGADAFEFLLAGADAVQIGTQFEEEGASAFFRIDNELSNILTKHGYLSVEDAKGRLKMV
jgi:dihydroorotate dehydrogenase (fumarate)